MASREAATARRPPARAAVAPSTARNNSDVSDTATIRARAGDSAATASGNAASAAKLAADVSAAYTGRALIVEEMPSSSRACEPSASCAINWLATCWASTGSIPRAT